MIKYDPAAGDIVVDISIGNLVNSFLLASIYDGDGNKLANLVDKAVRVDSDASTPEYAIPQAILQAHAHLILKQQHDVGGIDNFDFRAVTAFGQPGRATQSQGKVKDNVAPGSTIIEWIDLERI